MENKLRSNKLYLIISKYCSLSAESLYYALVLFFSLRVCMLPLFGALIPSLCAFFINKKTRINASLIYLLIFLPIWLKQIALSAFFMIVTICVILIIEQLRKKSNPENIKGSLLILIFALIELLLIDFSMHGSRTGLTYTFAGDVYVYALYRVLSIMFIVEAAKLLNIFIKSLKKSALIVFDLVFALSFVNYWIFTITKKAFTFSDIYLAKTAAGMLSGVNVKTTDILYFVLYVILVIVFNAVFIKLNIDTPEKKQRINRGALSMAVLALISFLMIGNIMSPLMYASEVRLGFPAHLLANMKKASKPSDYDEFQKQLSFKEPDNLSKKDSPNIIVIMSEAFSDLSVVGDVETNEDYMPYIRNLMKECPSGTLYSSVLGNNTCSSEYECLTGVPTALSDTGAMIYQKYMKEQTPSIVSLLKAQDYRTVGIHPYNGVGYNRKNAWKSFGFDEMHFWEDFKKPKKIRDLISDQSFYEKIIDTYNEKSDKPLFCFGISIQNHATYLSGYKGQIHLEGEYKDKYPDVDEYLSLIKETDDATKNLIDYFSSVDEDTIIVFFGDHQPMIDQQFYSDISGKDKTNWEIEDESKVYEIPYFVWSNYDNDIKVPEKASINYLPNVVINAAGVESNDWFNFTDRIFKDFPIVTDNFIRIDGQLNDKNEVVSKISKIGVKDTNNSLYKLKEFQVGSYLRSIDR